MGYQPRLDGHLRECDDLDGETNGVLGCFAIGLTNFWNIFDYNLSQTMKTVV
jgi:hypothetical protein